MLLVIRLELTKSLVESAASRSKTDVNCFPFHVEGKPFLELLSRSYSG